MLSSPVLLLILEIMGTTQEYVQDQVVTQLLPTLHLQFMLLYLQHQKQETSHLNGRMVQSQQHLPQLQKFGLMEL